MLNIIVEGITDQVIVQNILEAGKFPTEKIKIISSGGQSRISLYKEMNDKKNTIILMDSDSFNIPDARKNAKSKGFTENIFFAIPEIEAWLFADIKLLKQKIEKKQIERITISLQFRCSHNKRTLI